MATTTTTPASVSSAPSSSSSSSPPPSTLRLFIRCDYPPHSSTLSISSSRTIFDLKTEAATLCSIPLLDHDRYLYFNVVFGYDIKPLSRLPSPDINPYNMDSINNNNNNNTESNNNNNNDSFRLLNNQSLSDAKIRDRSTIFLSAPANRKPPIKKNKLLLLLEKQETEEGDNDGEGEKNKDNNNNNDDDNGMHRYKHIKIKNCIKRLIRYDNNKEGDKKERVLEFIDMYAQDIARYYINNNISSSTTINNNNNNKQAYQDLSLLSQQLLLDIIKRDTLSSNESVLFEWIVEWAKIQQTILLSSSINNNNNNTDNNNNTNNNTPSSTSLSPDSYSLRFILGPLLSEIRFPIMSSADLATRVASSSLLDAKVMVDLYSYAASNARKNNNNNNIVAGAAGSGEGLLGITPSASLLQFKFRSRKGRRKPAWFYFDTNKKYYSIECGELMNGEQSISTPSDPGVYMMIGGNKEISKPKKGDTTIYEYEIKINSIYTTNQYALVMGFVSSPFNNWHASQMIGYSGHAPGYGYSLNGAQKFNSGTQGYGRKCIIGDIIKVRLDTEQKTIEYFINGISQGIAFENISLPVRPAISMYGINNFTLRFP